MTREQFRDLKPGDQVWIREDLRDESSRLPRWKDEFRGTVATILTGVSADMYNGFEYVTCTMDPYGVWFQYELDLLPPSEDEDMVLDDSCDISDLF